MAAAPVLLGGALAWSGGATPRWAVFLCTLIGALGIQAGTNLYNDVRDAERGADGPGRIGPTRVTAAGLASPRQVRSAAASAFAVAFVAGLVLVAVGGWPILLIGLASLAAGYAYSAGARPLSHRPWGELFVMLFFGVLAVAGSFYLQAGYFSLAAALLGLALGAQASAVLLVNNVRDIEADRQAGRTTLVNLIGDVRARWLYAVLMLLPFLVLIGLPEVRALRGPWIVLPLCLWLAWSFRSMPIGPAMNGHLARSAQVQALFAILLSAGLLL